MAIFGYDTKGATEHFQAANTLAGTKFALSEAGTAVSITCYVKKYALTSEGHFKFAIYNSSLEYLGETEEGDLSTGLDDWVTLNLTESLELDAGDYFICRLNDTDWYLYYDSGTSNQNIYTSRTYGDGFPASFSGTGQSRKYSIYCTLGSASTNVTIEGVIGEAVFAGGENTVSTYATLPTVAESNIPATTGWMCWNVTNNVIDALYNGLSTLNVIISDSVENEGESLVMTFNSLNSEENKPRLSIDGEVTTASQATYIKNSAKTTNYSEEEYLIIDGGAATKTRILLQFSLEGITTVGTAVLCLYYVAGETDNRGRPVKLEKITNPNWVDDTATWNDADTGTPWETEGGDKTDEGEWAGSPAYTLPTRNSYNRFYVFRNIPTRWS